MAKTAKAGVEGAFSPKKSKEKLPFFQNKPAPYNPAKPRINTPLNFI
jgi:hypothetical protein